jgi:glycosyltransferase involved in cell wall biosynthesis
MWLLHKKRIAEIKGYLIRHYMRSEWDDYALWLFKNRLLTVSRLKDLNKKQKMFKVKPNISIVMPVYNPDPLEFRGAVNSILRQVYPYWELCIVDDLSDNRDYMKILDGFKDRRMKVYLCDVHGGIAGASQFGVEKATGEYIAFMDQDDELYPDALYSFVNILQHKEVDYFYSDRDMLSPQGRRYMHFFRPGWSPEYLMSFNYAPHLEIYNKRLLDDIGGFRKYYEGSHDYDLVLRATEKTEKIYHHAMILYSWRQSQRSIARNYEMKSYVYESGVRALSDAVKRRNLPVNEIVENSALWRGHYRIIWNDKILSDKMLFLIMIGRNERESQRLRKLFESIKNSLNIDFISTDYSIENINRALKSIHQEGHVFFCDDTVTSIVSSGLIDMLGYLSINGVGAVGCKFLDSDNRIFNAGISITTSNIVLFSYRGSPHDEHGYGAVASVPRNVSAVFPSFWGCDISALKAGGYLKNDRGYIHSAMSYFMEIIKSGQRIVCVPYMCLGIDKDRMDYDGDMKAFADQWASEGMRDKYYNPNLTDIFEDYGLKI